MISGSFLLIYFFHILFPRVISLIVYFLADLKIKTLNLHVRLISEQLNELNNTIYNKTGYEIDFDILHELDLLKKNQKSERLNRAIEGLKAILRDLKSGETQTNNPINNIHQIDRRQEIDPNAMKNLT